jgi:hypothetical protein
MANFITNWINSAGDWLGQKIAPYINDALGQGYNILGHYYSGNHRPQLKTKEGQKDDNIIQNFAGLAVDRSVSRLFRGGVQFNLPENATEQQEYIDKVWDLNKKEIILYQVGLHGAVYGTPYFKISPGEMIDPITGDEYPRLIAIDPEIIRVKTDPQDMNETQLYTISYKIGETVYWEITARSDIEYGWDGNGNIQSSYKSENEAQSITWVVDHWKQVGGGAREQTDSIPWQYDFPPIIHWKNLPSLKSCYGDSDIDDSINVQDKSNFVVSNTGKIIKFHAHPETVGTGFQASDVKALDSAVGKFHVIPNADAKVYNLEMASDLASSRAFALDLRQSIFDISREVDINSIQDKLGALTNFGLRVLYTDALDKNDTKRQLYGDAIKELNRRLLVLNNWTDAASDPGKITWGEALISNPMEEMSVDEKALNMGIIDKETITKRYQSRYGVSYEDVQAALKKQQTEANAQNDNIGAAILRNFAQGRGAPQNGNNLNAQPNNNTRAAAAAGNLPSGRG